MTIYNSIKQTGRYLLATGALLTALYSCENKSNFDNQSDLTTKYDTSLPDLENILSDMGLGNQIPSDLGNDGSPEEDYVLNRDGSIDIPLDDLYDNPDQIPSGELDTDGSPKTDYVLELGDIALATIDLHLEDLLQEDTDPCANNHPPTIYARTEPASGSTITLDDEMVAYIIEGAEDPDGNLDMCFYDVYIDDEYWFTAEDFNCKEINTDSFFELGTHRFELYAKDTCGVESERVISILYAIEN